MKNLRIRVFLLAAALTVVMTFFVGVNTASAHVVGHELRARLTGAAEIAGGDPRGRARAEIRLIPERGLVCFDIDTFRLSAPVTAAHIHQGVAGKNGPIVVDFKVQVNGLASCVRADRTLIQNILKDPKGFYANVHTTAFPGGAIRGQLFRGI